MPFGDGARVERVMVDEATPSPPPAIHVRILTPTLPTAYCHHLNADDFPFISVNIDNTHADGDDVSLIVTAVIEGYSDTVTASPSVKKGEGQYLLEVNRRGGVRLLLKVVALKLLS